MIVLLGIILVSRVHCRSLMEDLSESAMFPEINPSYIIRSDSEDKINEEYDTYINMKDHDADSNEFDILSEEQRIFSNGQQYGNERDRQWIQTYILVKTMRQRNKRYTSFHTLCHFKICNIGKKRRTAYINRMNNVNGL